MWLSSSSRAIEARNYRAKRGKTYVRNCNLKNAHGITIEQYNTLYEAQSGACAACFQPETGRNQYGLLPLAVDHDHGKSKCEPGYLRGLLCMRCNRALGLLRDDVAVIEQLLQYRRKCESG